MTQWMSDEQFQHVQKIARASLASMRKSGVVHTLRIYSAGDHDTCAWCKQHISQVVRIEDAIIGVTLPPFPSCTSRRCRCYFCRSASKTDPPSARDSAKPSGATLRCAPPGLALRRRNLEGGQLFDADPGQLFGAV